MTLGQIAQRSNIVRGLVVALLASLLTFMPGSNVQPVFASSHGITYNDQVCDLTNGDGSQATPYLISDADELWEVTDCSSATAHFEITNDIDVSQAQHAPTSSPIGYSTSSVIYSFSGILDGGSNLISYSSTAPTYASLFALVQQATIKQMSVRAEVDSSGPAAAGLASLARGHNTISEVLVTGSVSGTESSGGFIGVVFDLTRIETSFNFADVTIALSKAGGFVGDSQGKLDADLLSNFGNVSGRSSVGGILGAGSEAALKSVRNHGSVSAIVDAWAGGLIGAATTITISESINFGEVDGNDDGSGGLVGYSLASIEITSSQNRGSVSGRLRTGGLVGDSDNRMVIDNSTNHSLVQGLSAVGGLVGEAEVSTVSDSVNLGPVSGHDLIGGAIGAATDRLSVNNFLNSGGIVGVDGVGGIVGGLTENFSSTSLSNQATVSGRNSVGGFFGSALKQIELSNGTNTGTISASAKWAGGIAGYSVGSISLDRVSNFGNIEAGSDFAGGLAGIITTGNFSAVSSSNQASVTSNTNFAGGLVADVEGNATVSGVLNTGTVTAGNDLAGGFFGDVGQISIFDSQNSGNILSVQRAAGLAARADSGSIVRVLNSGSVTGQNGNDGLISTFSSLTTQSAFTTQASDLVITSTLESLRTASTFAGWDFTNTWGFGTCSENNGLPMLRVFNQVSTYYDTGCFTAPQQQQQNPGTSEPAPAPVYAGPVLDQVKVSVSTGERMVLTGSRLDTVVELSIGGIKQQIVSVTANSIEILVSSSTSAGVQDLVLVSSFGTLTAQSAVDVAIGAVGTEASSDLSQSDVVENELIGKTKMLSLNPLISEAWMVTNLEDSGLTRIVCTATVREGATHHQRVQARKLAKASCDAAAGYLESPSVWFQTKETRSRFIGRVFLTVKG